MDPVEHNVNIARALIGDLTKEELRDVSDDSVTSIALDEIELDESESLPLSVTISTEQEDSDIVEETESQEKVSQQNYQNSQRKQSRKDRIEPQSPREK